MFIPKPDPHFGIKKNEYGWYPYVYWINSPTSQTHFDNDYLVAHLLGVSPKQYSMFLKENGADLKSPKNKVTYFERKIDAENMAYIIEEMMNHSYYIDTKNQNDVLQGNMHKTGSDLASMNKTHYNTVRAYKNWQQLQGILPDINVTDTDSKEINSGFLVQEQFRKGHRYIVL